MPSIWDDPKAESASPDGGGSFMGPGLYEVKIIKCVEKETRARDVAFIVEFEILASTHAAHPVGSTGTWYQSMIKFPESAFSAVKSFVCAINRIDTRANPERVVSEINPRFAHMMKEACGQNNIFAGAIVHLECSSKETKKGGDFTTYRWGVSERQGATAYAYPQPTPAAVPPPGAALGPPPPGLYGPPQGPPPGYGGPPPNYGPPQGPPQAQPAPAVPQYYQGPNGQWYTR